MGWEPVEHTADVGVRIWADDLPGLFAEAALAVVGVMGSATGPAERTEHVDLEATDVEALLVDWMSEVIFLFEARDIVARSVSLELSGAPWRIVADVRGPSTGSFLQEGPQVKAVTYHGLELRRSQRRCEAVVYLDV